MKFRSGNRHCWPFASISRIGRTKENLTGRGKNPFFRRPAATQGCAAIFNNPKSLKMVKRQNHIFVLAG